VVAGGDQSIGEIGRARQRHIHPLYDSEDVAALQTGRLFELFECRFKCLTQQEKAEGAGHVRQTDS
jgi:hypothetical protein